MRLVDCFDDLAARFLLNLPYSEISSLPRFCFQVEEAQWFYEDFIRPMAAANGQQLPNLPLRQFSLLMFQHCPLWNEYDDAKLAAAYDLFLEYKVRVPVRGAILLDDKMERVVLVKGYKKGANWSFPRGKINRDEDDLVCAIREVYEETGFDIHAAGLVPQSEANTKYIDITMREQHMRMFVFRGVPLDTHFEPQTRKEISKVQFYNLKDLPGYRKKNKDTAHDQAHEVHQANKFYMVAPFLGPLKKWIGQQRRASGYVSTDANQYDTAALAGEDTDDAFAYHVPEVSNEDKSEALRKLLSIGAFPQSALPPTVIDPDTYNRAAAQHSQLSSVQSKQDHHQHQAFNAPPMQHTPQQNALLQIFQAPQQHSQAMHNAVQGLPGPHMPPARHDNFQHQHVPGPWSSVPQHQPQSHMAQQPVELSATSPQINTHSRQFAQLPTAASLPPQTGPSFQSFIAGVPRAPDAAQLAPPQKVLLQLLSAPKQPNSTATTGVHPTAIRQSNPQASKLLDLLKSPAAPPVPPVELSSDNTEKQNREQHVEKPIKTQTSQRRPTVHEFTRTLPSRKPTQIAANTTKPLVEPTVVPSVSNCGSSAHSSTRSIPILTRNEAHAVSDVSDAQASTKSARHGKTDKAKALDLPSTATASKSTRHTSKAKQKPAKADTPPTPSFTILTRPESLKNNASSNTQTQVASVESKHDNHADQSVSANTDGPKGTKQNQDKLLALFGSKSSSDTQTLPSNGSAVQKEKSKEQQHLLKLFEKSPVGSRPSARTSTPITPQDQRSPTTALPSKTSPLATESAPLSQPRTRPLPEQRPTNLDTTPQNPLLDLFKKNAGMTQSPETPISPFMLGSPQILRRPNPPDAAPVRTVAQQSAAGEPKRGSVSASTPNETRGFLLDYLNGVVQKEGNRG